MADYTSNRLQGLYRDVEASRRNMEPFRNNRREFVKELVGKHHSDNGTEDRVPINLLLQFVTIHLRLLASHNPAMSVSTPHTGLKSFARDMEAWGNWRIKEMDLESTLRRCVMDALLGLGIAKVGTTYAQTYEGVNHEYGEVFVDCIDFDDYVHDMEATSIDRVYFQGHRYRMLLEDAKNNPLFDEARRSELTGSGNGRYNEQGDERLKAIESQESIHANEFTEQVELWELWLPREQVILTCEYGPGGICGDPLRIVEWKGPTDGPFHLLSFVNVPSNTMPISPVGSLLDMHKLINEQMLKLARQSLASKTVLAAQGNAEADARTIIAAKDGDVVRVNHINMLKEIRFRGTDQSELAAMLQYLQSFDRQAGNLSTMGGLASKADTLGQEQMLQSQSSAQIKDMQSSALKFAKSILTSMAWHWIHEDRQTYVGERKVEGTDITVPVTITPDDRRNKFFLLNFDVQPFSLQGKTPQEKNAQIDMLLAQLLPVVPQLQAQGIDINWNNLLRLKAKYTGMDDLTELLTFIVPVSADQQPHSDVPRASTSMPGSGGDGRRSTATDEGMATVAMQTAQGAAESPGLEIGA